MTRCKFVVSKREEFQGGNVAIEASPVYSDDPASENKRFWKFTPSGSLKIHVATEARASLDEFKPGVEFYVDLLPLPTA